MKLLVASGYLLFGHKLPVRNTVLRGFAYIVLILLSSYLPNILAMAGGDGEIISSSLSAGTVWALRPRISKVNPAVRKRGCFTVLMPFIS